LFFLNDQDAFIGFGGNQVREIVKKEASWFVYSFYDLIGEVICKPITRGSLAYYQF